MIRRITQAATVCGFSEVRSHWSRVECAIFDKAQVVAPKVDDIERPLAPRSTNDRPSRLAVDLVWRESVELFGALVHCIDVADAEVQRLWTRCGTQSALRRVEYRENHATAIEVVAGTRMALALNAQQLGVKRDGLFQVPNLYGDAEEGRYIGWLDIIHGVFPFGCVWRPEISARARIWARSRPMSA